MKCLKKVIALAIVATMILGLCVINVSAADLSGFKVVFKNASGSVVNFAKPGAELTAEVYIPEGTYTSAAVTLVPNADAGVELSNIVGANGISFSALNIIAANGRAQAKFTNAGGTSIGKAPYFTVDVTVPSGATPNNPIVLFTILMGSNAVTGGVTYTIPTDGWGLQVLDGFTVASAEYMGNTSFEFGVNKEYLETYFADKQIRVFNDGKDKYEDFDIDEVLVTASFQSNTAGTFENAVKLTVYKESFTDDKLASAEDDVLVEIPITVTPYDLANGAGFTGNYTDMTYTINEEGGQIDEDGLVEDFNEKGYTGTVTLDSRGYVENVNVVAKSASGMLDLTQLSDINQGTNVVVLTLGIVSTSGNLTGDLQIPNAIAYVIPAEIKGGNFKVTGTRNTAKPVIDVTLPDGFEPAMGDEVVATIYDDEFEPVKTITKEILLGSSVFETGKIKLESDKMLKEMGFTVGDTFYVGVDYNGAALVLPIPGAVEAYTPYKECKVLAQTSGGGTGGFTPGTDVDAKEYSVNIGETENGKVVASATRAAEGTVVTVTATPNEGYYLADVTVYDAAENEIAVVDNAFTMPANSVIIYATFAEGEEPITPPVDSYEFADVPTTHWAYEYIGALKALGIVGGVDEEGKYYEPESNVTRAEFTKMIVGILGLDVNPNATVDFTDAKNDWYTPYIAAAVEAGIVNGVSDTEFAPNAAISRQDACTILGRIFIGVDAPEFDILKWNDSAKIADYAKQYVQILAALEIVNGYGDNTFRPTENITRAEAAKVIYLSMAELAIESVEEEIVEEAIDEGLVTEEEVEAAIAEELGIEAE